MAFTEAQLVAQLDPNGTGRVINIQTLIPGPVVTDCYGVGVIAPYAGRERWVQLTSSNTAAQAAAQLQAALTQ
jgi:hypothetical protein